jgi:hypothetical protein
VGCFFDGGVNADDNGDEIGASPKVVFLVSGAVDGACSAEGETFTESLRFGERGLRGGFVTLLIRDGDVGALLDDVKASATYGGDRGLRDELSKPGVLGEYGGD